MRKYLTILFVCLLQNCFAQTPTANAGSDQTIYLTTTNNITLTGTATNRSTSLWREVSTDYLSGTTITNSGSLTATVSGLPQGVFYFELAVTSANSVTIVDTMKVTVNYAPAPGTLMRSLAAVYPQIKVKVNDRTDTLNTNTGEEIYPITFPDGLGNEVFFDRNRSNDMFIDAQNGKFYSTVEDGYDWNNLGYGRSEMSFGDYYNFDTTKTYCMEWKGYFPQDFSTMALNQTVAIFLQIHAHSDVQGVLGTQMIKDGTGTHFIIDDQGTHSVIADLSTFINQTHTVRVTFKEGTPGQFYKVEVDGVQKYLKNTGTIGGLPRGQDYPKIATLYDYGNALVDPANNTRGRKFSQVTEDFSIYDVSSSVAAPTISISGDQTINVSNTGVSAAATWASGHSGTYLWTKTSGGSATITNNTSSSASISNLSTGTYVFRCTATQDDSQVVYAEVTVTVNLPSGITNYFISKLKNIYINN